jgi:SAM-dependent methyltransferase
VGDFTLKDIHDLEFEDAFSRQFDRDTEALLAQRARFVDGNCPACGNPDKRFQYRHKGFDHQRCPACGTLFISPCPTEAQVVEFLGSSEALRFWRDEMPARVVESRKAMYRERADFVQAVLAARGIERARLLEVGGGRGELAVEMAARPSVAEIVVFEPQPLELACPGVTVISSAFDPALLENARVDVVVAFEVFEHVIDPSLFLASLRRTLKPGGLLILSTPNIDGFQTRVLGTKTSTIGFDHVRLYNPRSLAIVLERNGFSVDRLETPGRLDVEIVHRVYASGELRLDDDPALLFLMEDGYKHAAELQRFLQSRLMSSSMRCVATRSA